MKTSNRFAVLAGVAAIAFAISSASAQTTTTGSCVFNTNLKVGQRSADVINLQKVLNSNPATSIGNAGKETNFFGPATFAAVKRFQAANNITPVSGFVGALTRAALNKACSTGGSTTVVDTTNTNTTPTNNVSDNSQPSGTVFLGQASARIATFTLTGNNTVNAIELTKIGVSSNDLLQNVYLYVGGTRVSDAASVNSSGKINVNGLNLQVNGSLTVTVRVDLPATGNYVGQSVGVALTGVRNIGETAYKPVTGVAGNLLSVGSGDFNRVTLTNVNTSTTTPGATINAGSMNQVFHDITLRPGSRAAYLKSISYRYVGSANANTDVTNLALYVDNNKVATGMINGNSYVVFDLSNNPVSLNTGDRAVQLRGDIIGGSTRNFQFSIQYAADLLVEDSQVSGFGLPVTGAGNVSGKYIVVGNGSLVINQNPAFTITRVSSGASNQTIANWTFTGYGDTTKVEQLAVSVTAPNNLQNVSLYVNGGQVGQQFNMTGTAGAAQTLTYFLGSNLVTEPGRVNVVELKGDLRDNNGNNTPAGTIRVSIVGASSIARTQKDNNTVTISNQDSKSLTVGGVTATVSKTGGFLAYSVSPNTAGTKIGSITLSNDDNEDLLVNNVALTITTDSLATAQNINNVRVASTTSNQVYSPLTAATGVYNFTTNDTVVRNGSRTYDVYADIGSVASAATVTVTGSLSYRGIVSNVITNSVSTTGVPITFRVGTLAANAVTLKDESLKSRVLTGTASRNIAKFTVKSTGGAVTVNELHFTTTPADYITYITVGGIRQAVVSGATTRVTGLSINVPDTTQGTDIDVAAEFSPITGANGSLSGQSSAATTLTLAKVVGRSGNTDIRTGENSVPSVSVASNPLQLNGSVPSRVWLSNGSVSVGAGSNSNVKVGTISVSADAAGDIRVKNIPFSIGVPTGGTSSNTIVKVNNSVDSSCTVSGSNVVCAAGKTIPASSVVTFDIFTDFTGVTTSGNASLNLGAAANFTWDDVNGNQSGITGALVNGYNN